MYSKMQLCRFASASARLAQACYSFALRLRKRKTFVWDTVAFVEAAVDTENQAG